MWGQSVVGWSVVGPQYIHCSHVLLFATLGTQRMMSKNWGLWNPMKMFSKNRTEANWRQNSKTKNSVSAVWFSKNRLRRFWDGFHVVSFTVHHPTWQDQQSKVFFFIPNLCTSSSELLWLTISWTNSAWKYVISSVILQRRKWKMASTDGTETTVNFVKPKPNQKLQFLQNRTENWTGHF